MAEIQKDVGSFSKLATVFKDIATNLLVIVLIRAIRWCTLLLAFVVSSYVLMPLSSSIWSVASFWVV